MCTSKYTSQYTYLSTLISVDGVFTLYDNVHQTYLLLSFTRMRVDAYFSLHKTKRRKLSRCAALHRQAPKAGPCLKSRGLQDTRRAEFSSLFSADLFFWKIKTTLVTESSEESETAHYLLETCSICRAHDIPIRMWMGGVGDDRQYAHRSLIKAVFRMRCSHAQRRGLRKKKKWLDVGGVRKCFGSLF